MNAACLVLAFVSACRAVGYGDDAYKRQFDECMGSNFSAKTRVALCHIAAEDAIEIHGALEEAIAAKRDLLKADPKSKYLPGELAELEGQRATLEGHYAKASHRWAGSMDELAGQIAADSKDSAKAAETEALKGFFLMNAEEGQRMGGDAAKLGWEPPPAFALDSLAPKTEEIPQVSEAPNKLGDRKYVVEATKALRATVASSVQKDAKGGIQEGAARPGASQPSSPAGPRDLERMLTESKSIDHALWRRVGDLYAKDKQPADAVRAYERANALQPRARNYANLARLAAQQGDMEGARSQALKALELDPQNSTARLIVGHSSELTRAGGKLPGKAGFGADSEAGAPGGAARPMGDLGRGASGGESKVSFSDPGVRLSPLVLKAEEKARLGDYTGSMMLLTQALDENPKDAAAWALRAELQNKLGDHEAARLDAEKALALEPRGPAAAKALRARAFAYLQQGKPEQALADAILATELEPGSGLGFLYKAQALAKLGRKAEAVEALRRAVALDPTLRALARPLFKELGAGEEGGGAAAEGDAVPAARGKLLLRGGTGAAAIVLVLLGLLGTKAGRALTTRPPKKEPSSPSEQATIVDAPERSPGSLVGGQYRITRELGRGGMGVVYEAEDETLRRRVALKLTQGGQGADLERFLREARLVASLKHPRIAEIHNVVLDREPVLVFELVEGQPLDALLKSGRLEPARALWVMRQVCEALAYAHGRGIIHRDLKPANVMLSPDGSCKVMDFGIAHQASGAATQTQTAACGTPLYMAPEQGFGTVSKASDLYALAVMAYELLTGTHPFGGPGLMEDKLHGRFKPASEAAPSLPKALDGFFVRALSAEPGGRFATVEQFREAFESALAGKALSA